MQDISPFLSTLKEWTQLNVKGIIYDSSSDTLSAATLLEKTLYHRNVMFIAKMGDSIFGSFNSENVPYTEDKMNAFIENDCKHFIFTLQNTHNTPMKFEPSYNDEFTSLYVYGKANKRNVMSAPNAFFVNVGPNSYISKRCFDYYNTPEGADIDATIFTGTVQPSRFTVDRLIAVEWDN